MAHKLTVLKKGEIKKILKQHSSWSINPKQTVLYRTYEFPNQIDALAFIARIVVHAQVLSHYPEILFSFGKVKISISTSGAKGVTNFDADLLSRVDALTVGG